MTYEEAKEMLDAHTAQYNMRRTPERYEVLRAVTSFEGRYSVEDITEKMKSEGKFQVGPATLFNTMQLLMDAQMVVRHHSGRKAVYENNFSGEPVICLKCVFCGAATNLDDPELKAQLAAIKSRRMQVVSRLLYLSGVCRKCAAKKHKKKQNDPTNE